MDARLTAAQALITAIESSATYKCLTGEFYKTFQSLKSKGAGRRNSEFDDVETLLMCTDTAEALLSRAEFETMTATLKDRLRCCRAVLTARAA